MFKKEFSAFIKQIQHQRIILRADLNVPLNNNFIANDSRLKAFLPTLKALSEVTSSIRIITHLGRPVGKDMGLSTAILAAWIKSHGIACEHYPSLENTTAEGILIMENLRFWGGEQAQDDSFAELLAKLGEFFIFDAFGVVHRNDTSVSCLPGKFAQEKRNQGPLIEQEARGLSVIRDGAEKPFIMVLGGKKVKDKLPLLEAVITAPPHRRPSHILVGGLIAWELMRNQGALKDLQLQAAENGVSVVLPSDWIMSQSGSPIDIGQETINCFSQIIQTAKTIFANGTMGVWEDPASAHGSFAILTAIAKQADAQSVIGGGDCIAAADACKASAGIDFISTGGGATLAFLAAKSPSDLPGLSWYI